MPLIGAAWPRRTIRAAAIVSLYFCPAKGATIIAPSVEMVAPSILGTPLDERSVTFSPDGNLAIFAVRLGDGYLQVLCFSNRVRGRWSQPEVLPFSGRAVFDGDPYFSSDGTTLYFASSRTPDGKGEGDLNIWSVRHSKAGWGRPRLLPGDVNTSANERSPVVLPSGRIYFTSSKNGRTELFTAELEAGRYTKVTALPDELNDDGENVALAVSTDEKTIVFASIGRADEVLAPGENYPRGDLYLSRKIGGRWGRAIHLPPPINSEGAELFPSFSADGRWLYFMSERGFASSQKIHLTRARMMRGLASSLNGRGNIYRIDARSLDLYR